MDIERLKESAEVQETGVCVMSPHITLVVPAFNEAALIESTLAELCSYLDEEFAGRAWEMLVVDDGSSDDTAIRVEEFAGSRAGELRIVRHAVNSGLGAALKTGFAHARGECIVTLDADLSYSPDHIGRLYHAFNSNAADIVVASPYMRGGSVANVPRWRLAASRIVNHLLARSSSSRVATSTGMVRAYRAAFVKELDIQANGMEFNADSLRLAEKRGARVVEIPARLEWRRSDSARRSAFNPVRYGLALLRSTINFPRRRTNPSA